MFDFSQLDASDGYDVVVYDDHPTEIGLYIILRQGGVPTYTTSLGPFAEVWKASRTAENEGVRARLQHFIEALVRYFNNAGSWEELDEVLAKARMFIAGGMYYEGWHYQDGWFEDDCPVDVFVCQRPDIDAVVAWVRGCTIDITIVNQCMDGSNGRQDLYHYEDLRDQ